VKYGPARKRRRNFRCKFRDERNSSRKTIKNLVNNLRSTGLLIEKKQKRKRRVLSEGKLDNIGARLEHTPRKSLKHLTQETAVLTSSTGMATQLLKLRPYKTTAIQQTLQPRDPASKVHFYSWVLQSVVEGEIDPQLTYFLIKRGFTCREGYVNTQNNSYWSSQIHI
jgi:hypothetical protein